MTSLSSNEGRPPSLQAARCDVCQGYSYPVSVPGCRHCGALSDALQAVDCMDAVPVINVITVHAALAPGLAVPAIIGEVELCPGLVEEVRIDAADESAVPPGTLVRPVWVEADQGGGWVFRALTAGEPLHGEARR